MLKQPFTEVRPWGEFRQYTDGESVVVKIIFIKSGETISLQYHSHRSEFWRIIKGTPEVTIGEEKKRAKPGDEFVIDTKAPHRIAAVDEDVEFLEIARGDFDEADIVRLDDKYGRS